MSHMRARIGDLAIVLFALFVLAGCAGDTNRLSAVSTFAAMGTPAFAQTGSGKTRPGDPGLWRTSSQTLFAGPMRAREGLSVFSFSGLQARSVKIGISLVGTNSADLSLACDGPFSLTIPGDGVRKSDGAKKSGALVADELGRTGAVIDVSPGLDRCEATFRFANSSRTITLRREETSNPELLKLDTRFDICALPDTAKLDPLERVFYGDTNLTQTCPFPIGKPVFLEREKEAFNAKVSALLGKPLSGEFLQKADPGAPIDFSAAPELSAIFLSTLDYKADFSGAVVTRLLRHHAARGTKIRLLVSSVLESRKDARMIEELASDYPNVSLRKFAYEPELSLSPDEALAGTHRVNHIKLFIVLGRNPAKSVAIIGGRNIHDGFLYSQPVNLDAYPHLQHYGAKRSLTLNYYSNWHDFDLAFHDDKTARLLASHLSTIWHDDDGSLRARPFSARSQVAGGQKPGQARHFMSVPFVDGRALETYYVNLIDAAQHSIELVNPYLNPTDAIGQALDRAIARGVRIEIIGRIDMRGDLGGEVLTALNEEFFEKNRGRMEILDYKAPDVVLHAKILMIDQRLVSVSSVNLNNRSFLHDSENGVVVLDNAFYKKMRVVFDFFKSRSRPVDKNMSWSAWKLLLMNPTVRHAL